MSIVETTFAPSKKPYAIDWSTFETRESVSRFADGREVAHHIPRVRALWVGRKHGTTYVSEGWLVGRLLDRDQSATIGSFMTNFDPRYGGDCEARWNGHDLWTQTQKWTIDWVVAQSKRLDEVLQNLPALPAGYDGWYRLHDKNVSGS